MTIYLQPIKFMNQPAQQNSSQSYRRRAKRRLFQYGANCAH